MSHAFSELPALKPAASENPLSASAPWNLVAAFSLFGHMFFPGRKQGFAEIYLTLKRGGSIALTSCAPVDQSPSLRWPGWKRHCLR